MALRPGLWFLLDVLLGLVDSLLRRGQVLDGWAIEHASLGAKAASMAGAVPTSFNAVPLHKAAHVRTNRRKRVENALVIAVRGDFFAIHFQDFSTTIMKRGERCVVGQTVHHKMLGDGQIVANGFTHAR